MQIHVLARFAQRCELGHHFDCRDARTLECLQQTIAPVDELFNLLTCQLTTTRQFAQHTLAIGTCLVHHVAALLLGHLHFGFGVGRRVLTATSRLDLGLLTKALSFVGCFAQQPGAAVFGAGLDLHCGFTRRLQYACSFFAEQTRCRVVVHLNIANGTALLRGS